MAGIDRGDARFELRAVALGMAVTIAIREPEDGDAQRH
jgi:hypothetical protein